MIGVPHRSSASRTSPTQSGAGRRTPRELSEMPESGEHRPNPGSPVPQRQAVAAGPVRTVAELLDPPQGPDELGRVAGYRVLRLVGEGGMGCVYLAEETRGRRPVAVKFLLPALAGDETCAARFLRE